MSLKNLKILLLMALTTVLLKMSARADSPARPSSYTTLSPDGRFVFVMIAPFTPDEEMRNWTDPKAAEIRAIRQKYAQSGLYRADGSSTPLWTVDWYAYSVDVASDGVHLVRDGPWASRVEDEAFSIFANGQLVRRYAISELIDSESRFDRSVSHFWWSEGGRLDDAAHRYHLSTKDGNKFIFDIRDGSIIQKTRSGLIVDETRGERIIKWTVVAVVATITVLLVARALRRRNARRAERTAEEGPPLQ